MLRDALFHGRYAAEYYDKLMAGSGCGGYLETAHTYRESASIIATELRRRNPDGTRLLEVGCGTGNFCIEFAKLGFIVKGTDFSRDLLKRARQKSPATITYTFADMRDFIERKRFDYLVCLFDTFTYNQSIAEVRKTLECMKHALNDGGVLALDYHCSKPTKTEISVTLPGIALSNGQTIKETVYIRSNGNMTLRRSVQKIFCRNTLIKERTVPRLPRLRLNRTTIKALLRNAGFTTVTINAGFDGQQPQHLLIYATKKHRTK